MLHFTTKQRMCFLVHKNFRCIFEEKILNAILMNSFLVVYVLVSVCVRYQSIPSIDNDEQEKQKENFSEPTSEKLKT